MTSQKSYLKEVAIVVPARNEETVLSNTLTSLLKIVGRQDIYLANDASTDHTESIAKEFGINVLTLAVNSGKAAALNRAIEYFYLTDSYRYIMPMDADTSVSEDFLKNTLPILEDDWEKTIACVVGKVLSRKNSWVSFYRLWEYEITQSIHKEAQNRIGAVAVCPGCATIYRAEIFKKIKIPSTTLTEDMDLTFLLHRKRMGRIVFENKALVFTQDPQTPRDLVKQIDRWYTGFWQCLIKHSVPWKGQVLDLEIARV